MSSRNIQDIYSLSPMQHGMLFHAVYEPHSRVYLEQHVFALKGALDLAAFRRAWERVIERHAVLRTLFAWEKRERPLQLVRERIALPWAQHDWRGAADQDERLEGLLEADRARGFDLAQAPLMRLTLIQRADEAYWFVWSLHHLLLDGWSTSIIFRELLQFYNAFRQGEALHLEPPRPYRDYIAWLQRQDLSKAEAFWKEALAGFTTPTSPGVQRALRVASDEKENNAVQQVHWPPEATERLQSFVRQHRLTLNTLIQGAWALLLSRYSGQDDVVFGVTVAGRPADLAGVESMVGLFINTLPARVRVSPQATALEWLIEIQAQQRLAQQYEYTPLVDVQRWSQTPRGTALFESLLVFENYPLNDSREQLGKLDVRAIGTFEKTNYPITVLVVPGDELALRVLHDCTYYDGATIARLLAHLQTLVERLVSAYERPLSTVSLLTESERRQLLVEWNDTCADVPFDTRLHDLFEAQVERTPDAVAVVFGDVSLTYAELNRRANQLAHYLQARGIGPDVPVGVCLERSPELAIGVLGILKAGGAYLPLDPAYPRERLAYMLETATQAQPGTTSVLLTQTSLLEHLPISASTRVVRLDADAPAIRQESEDSPRNGVTGDNLCYVIFTSGSTGKPKGVMLPHRALVNLCAWQRGNGILPQPARTLQFAPLSFDASCQELFSTWSCGGTLVLLAAAHRREPEALLRLLIAEKIERLFLPFVALHQLAEAAESDKLLPVSLRDIVTAGEQLHITSPIANLLNRLAGCTLHNQYGPTESHVVTAFTLRGSVETWPTLPPIGKPIANTHMYVLDAQLQPAPIGVAGELYIGGMALARGYLGRPDLTAERFIPNPFIKDEGGRRRDEANASSSFILHHLPPKRSGGGSSLLYKTGDLARWQPDGNLEFLGRLDQQVKVRGYRIELGEIEAVLGQHAGVREAVVVAREDGPGDKRLVAYIVADESQPPTVSDLRGFVQRQLPDYMLPAAFVMLEALPLTPSGKVDRRALPAPDQTRPALAQAFAPPRTPLEETLARVWAEVLKVERVGVHDNFFELGGDSILTLRVVALAKQAGLSLTPRQLFENPTIAELAALEAGVPVETAQGAVTGAALLLPGQDWFFRNAFVDPPWWNVARVFKVSRRMAAPALWEQAVRHVLCHHDALRARFVHDGSSWQQTIAALDDGGVPFASFDLSDLPAQAQEAKLTAIASDLQKSLDLANGPIWRVALFDLGARRPAHLLVIVHHLVSDEVSIQIMLEDLITACQQLNRGEAVHLPPKTTSVQEWGKRLHAYARSEAFQGQLAGWLALPWERTAPLPVDYPAGREKRTADSVASVWVSLSTEESSALLKALPKAYEAQVFDALLTALVQSVSRWTGNRWVAVNTVDSGRTMDIPGAEDVDLSRTVGWLATGNCLLLENRDTGDPVAALQSIREQVARFPKYGIPMQLADLPIAHPIRSRFPEHVTDLTLNYTGQTVRATAQTDLIREALVPVGAEKNPASHEIALLACSASVWGGRLFFTWRYGRHIHKESTIKRVAGDFIETLKALAARC